MAQTQHNDDDVISGINVTPLVDIVLVILIVFIVTTSLVMRNSIPMDLPSAQTGQEQAAGPINVAVTKSGKIYINGKPGDLSDIALAVNEARQKNQGNGATQKVSAFVAADKRAAYGTFAQVVDELRLAGVIDIALDTQPVAVSQEGT